MDSSINIPAAFPQVQIEINSPGDFVAVLRAIRRCLEDGTLRQVTLPTSLIAQLNFAEIPISGPWPDYVEGHFKTAKGATFVLQVESYHGTGGSWTPVDGTNLD